MPQPIPTSPLDSHTPSDEVRFDLHKGGEYLSAYEEIATEREINEATQRALAAASKESLADYAVNTLAGNYGEQAVKRQEVPRVSIDQLMNAGKTIAWARNAALENDEEAKRILDARKRNDFTLAA